MNSFIETYVEVLKKFSVFNGRTRRRVYWSFF